VTELSGEAVTELAAARDPEFLGRLLPVLDRLLAYFDPVVEGWERLPADGPFMVVGNHSGGVYMPDYWAFQREWLHRRGPHAPLYSLGFDFTFAMPGVGDVARRIGSVPASQANGGALLDAGHPIVVYPGGDEDDLGSGPGRSPQARPATTETQPSSHAGHLEEGRHPRTTAWWPRRATPVRRTGSSSL
jgi:hypothetical protein